MCNLPASESSPHLKPAARTRPCTDRWGEASGAPHHSPTFDIDEESLVIGAELVTRTVVRYLEQNS